MKNNLSDNVIDGITYKQVRDAFKGIAFAPFNIERFTANLFFKEIKEICPSSFTRTRADVQFTIHRHLTDGPYPREVSVAPFVEQSKLVIEQLIEDKLIEVDEDTGDYSITKDGHSLRMQKAIKRIPLKRAEALIVKMLNSIEAFNKDPNSPYTIDQVYLFGSVQRHEKDAGDIDIAFSYSQNRHPGESYDDYIDRLCEHYNVSSWDIVTGRLDGKVTKALNVSPYISATDVGQLQSLMEKGADGSLLYQFKDDEKLKINVQKYEFKTIRKEADLDLAM